VTSLGEFGAAMRELDPAAPKDTFTFFGEPYEIVGPIPAILMLQLGAAATGKLREQDLLAAVWDALLVSLDEEDREPVEGVPAPVKQFDRLRQAAMDNRADLETLMKLTMALFQATDGRPTEAVPGSGPGPQSVSPSSNTSSSTPPDSGRPVSILTPLPGMRMVSDVLAV
jgi:hypothetical protein